MQQDRRYELEHVDFGALTRETVDAFAHGLAGQFTFHVDIEGPGPYVHVDPAAIEQALANLLDNAVKYSDTIKEITVRVRSDRHAAIVEITDRGVGVAAADHDRASSIASIAPRARCIGRDSDWACRSCASWCRRTAAAST